MQKCPNCGTRYNNDLQFCPNDGTRLVTEQRALTLAGRLFNERYQITEELDPTGLWEVCLANDILSNNKLVVVKILKLKPELLKQYQAKLEFRLHYLSMMHHPNILEILHYGFQQDCFYVVSEFALGKDLKRILKEKIFLPTNEALTIITQIVNAIQYLHANQLLHLELSLSKIFLIKNPNTIECIKIDAIGQIIPESIEKIGEYVRENSRYQAPELWLNKMPDLRCDIYSIGIICYELLTGVFPFPPSTSLVQNAKPVIPPMSDLCPTLEVPIRLEKAIYKAIQRNPQHRFQHLQSFSEILLNPHANHQPTSFRIRNLLWASLFFIIALIIFIPGATDWLSEQGTILLTNFEPQPAPEIQIAPIIFTQRKNEQEFRKKLAEIQAKAISKETQLCLIPEGTILCPDRDNVMRIIHVPFFQIEPTEVTNKQYAEFITSTGYPAPPHWINQTYLPELEHHPVVMIDWYSANCYAIWQKMRLPSEIEWQRAAQGDTNRKFPWGDTYLQGFANVKSNNTVPVGKFNHAGSQFGVFDLAGNVWEWTDTWYQSNHQDKVIRGGSFLCSPEQVATDYRDGFLPEQYREDIGFRCAKN